MALAPWYHRCELLCLAIERTTDLLCEVIDRVEVEGGFVYCWAGDHRVTLRETWPSYDGDAAIAAGMQARVGHTPAVITAGMQARVGHTPARVEIVLTEVIPRSALRRALARAARLVTRWLDRT